MTSARTITLVPVVYDHTDATDFKKMIPRTMKEGEKAIFLFNDISSTGTVTHQVPTVLPYVYSPPPTRFGPR